MRNLAEILVVDDMPTNLEVVTETLSAAGYTVAAVTNGNRALKRLQTYLPDLILLDVQMPGINGFETCAQLKSNPKTASIPIVFMTALSDLDSKLKGFDLGGVDYITKPFQEKELLARVKTHLQLRRFNQELEEQVSDRTAELQALVEELKQSQLQLIQSEKMSALGNLVAGIAHEINNPIGFLHANLQPAREYVRDLLELIVFFLAEVNEEDPEIKARLEEIDFDFAREDLPALLESMALGIDRIRQLSQSLRIFSRQDRKQKVKFNLEEGLKSTLLILQHRIKANDRRPAIQIVQEYDDAVPVFCFPGQLNQVFMNILANAIDCFEMANKGKSYDEIAANPNQIAIRQFIRSGENNCDCLWVQIEDNGCGMDRQTQEQVFQQGFTTKDIGQGTGLGMAIARQIIMDNHGGTLECQSELGKGTIFTITLPIEPSQSF